MKRKRKYQVNRTKFPVVDIRVFRYTKTHSERLKELADHDHVTRPEALRRCIDFRYEALFLSSGSPKRTDTPTEPPPT